MKFKRKMVQCATRVNRDAVRRESINGVEHVIVSSFTLPDNVVMNGGLYPAEEIKNSFASLERTLAPVEHPSDANGQFIPATDPLAINNFYAGAYNVNVSQEGGRIHIEKHINVQEALKTERGKRLMDRIGEIETNSDPRPIHTSVGVFLEVEELDTPKTNKDGAEYTWIARNMFFDHDAILLDSVGAAQPSQGVGMAVNSAGVEFEAEHITIDQPDARPDGGGKAPSRPDTNDMRTNAGGPSFASISEELQHAINGVVTSDWIWLADVFDGEAIFETNQGFFSVPWSMSAGHVELAGIPIRVDRLVSYQPKVNSHSEGENGMFKELILNALAEAGIKTDGLGDKDLLAKYNELLAVEPGGSEGEDTAEAITQAVTNAVKPLTEQISALTAKVNANDEAEVAGLIATVVNSKKYEGLDEVGAKALPLETLKTMAASCGTAYGVSLETNQGGQDDEFKAPADMPE